MLIRQYGVFIAPYCVFFFTACDSEIKPAPFSDEADRIVNSQTWGEKQDADIKNKAIGKLPPSLENTSLPDDLPSPELFETTKKIYSIIIDNKEHEELLDYRELVPAAGFAGIDMIAIPAGKSIMGSPENEPHRKSDEGPAHEVYIDAFWISSIEIPWEIYRVFMENGMPRNKAGELLEKRLDHELWDGIVQPTVPYIPMNLGMGSGYQQGYPAIGMSHYAACKFCEWLSAQTGHYYRLPTEAEWEYACRSGSRQAFCFGDNEEDLKNYAWYWNNSHDQYQKTATKNPNGFNLYDMHGNVAEWVLDSYDANAYSKRLGTKNNNPLVLLPGNSGHVVRGGSWEDDPDALRCASRRQSHPDWNMQDPQNPKSIWYLTDGGMIGFRIVRPVKIPNIITMHRLWNTSKGKY